MSIELPDYVDDGALREQDDVPVANFLNRHDRARLTGRGEPFFSGRETEINAFFSAATGLLLEEGSNATIVIEGPPGAGKSALLAQFEEEMRTFPPVGESERRWLPVHMDGLEADSPSEVMAAIDDAMSLRLAQDALAEEESDGGTASRRLLNWMQEVGGGSSQAKVGNLLASAQRIIDERGGAALGFRIGSQRDLSSISMRGVAARRKSAWKHWQIVLLIDEAQRIANAGGALAMLHQNKLNLPVSFCAFGLPGTYDALHEVGVSRGTAGYHKSLAGLMPKDAGMAVRRCFAHYGVTHAEHWEDAILSRSADWPQHLAIYLNSAIGALRGNAQSPKSMGDARRTPMQPAIALADEHRKDYYAGRLRRLTRGSNEEFRDYATSLAPDLREAPEGLMYQDILSVLDESEPGISREAVKHFLSAAIHSGFLAKDDGTGRHTMPIPSFASHVLGEPLPPIKDHAPAALQDEQSDDHGEGGCRP